MKTDRMAWLTFFGAMLLATQGPGAPAKIDERLAQYLRRFPEADANRDGVLTEAEARAHRQSRKGSPRPEASAAERTRPAPTLADVAYGDHARHRLDFWRAPGAAPTPVLVFFHGGSFKAGDKASILTRPIFQECLEAGISVVSVNYRFSTDAPYPAPMHDGARAVQFVRSKAREWSVDPSRVAVSGSSAGATLALWIALHDDLAEPSGTDPVVRQSTRVRCATPHSGTAGLTPEYFKEHAGVTQLGGALFQLFGVRTREELNASGIRERVRDASPIVHASPDDPPLFLTYAGEPREAPFAIDAPQSAWIHHVALGLPLKARYDALGLDCELFHRGRPPPAGAEIAFLKRHLFTTAPGGAH